MRSSGRSGCTTPRSCSPTFPGGSVSARWGSGPVHEEIEVVRAIDKILSRNRPYSGFATFLGGRIAPRFVPAAVDAILLRSEFYTSYTPYQPEASQGMLQALFEFQSLWVELTGLDAANASLYDGATAAGEALLLSRRIHEGEPVPRPGEPALGGEERPRELRRWDRDSDRGDPVRPDVGPDRPRLGPGPVARGGVFGVLIDVPNGFGHVDEGLLDLRPAIGDVPLRWSPTRSRSPSSNPPGTGGPTSSWGKGRGSAPAHRSAARSSGCSPAVEGAPPALPGRIVGATNDAEGRRAFTLTLQTREQHIRRSRATSNICTNQSLLALAFVVYATTVGPRGLADLAADRSPSRPGPRERPRGHRRAPAPRDSMRRTSTSSRSA